MNIVNGVYKSQGLPFKESGDRSGSMRDSIDETDLKILAFIAKNPDAKIKSISEAIFLTVPQVHTRKEKLNRLGFIEFHKVDDNGNLRSAHILNLSSTISKEDIHREIDKKGLGSKKTLNLDEDKLTVSSAKLKISSLNNSAKEVLGVICSHPNMGAKAISEFTPLKPPSIKKYVQQLRKLGFIRHEEIINKATGNFKYHYFLEDKIDPVVIRQIIDSPELVNDDTPIYLIADKTINGNEKPIGNESQRDAISKVCEYLKLGKEISAKQQRRDVLEGELRLINPEKLEELKNLLIN